MRLLLLPLALLGLAACASDPAPVSPDVPALDGTLELVDDGAADAGFAAFRDSLRAVGARRDTAGVLALVAEGARLSFGADAGGPEGLRTMWLDGDPPDARGLWAILEHVLAGGSVEEDGAFVAPSIASLWPDDLDPYGTVAVLGKGVAALDAPGGDTLATLSRLALARPGPPADGWQAVVLPDGRDAVVRAEEVYSPVGYRLSAWDDGAGWRIQTLLSGD